MEFLMDEGLWLKGCLHCHSTVSDGRLSPEDVARYYEDRGYRLLSIADHGKIAEVKGFKGTYLTGVELSRGKNTLGQPYHLMVLGVDDPSILTIEDAQTLIDHVGEAGGLTFIAHPYWSNLVHEDLAGLKGYVGIEVYNTGCDVEVAKGYSSTHWDSLLSAQRLVWGLAVDDAHRYTMHPIDADAGWIWVKVDEEKPEAVLKALRNGEFYSSMGPRIFRLSFSNGSLKMASSHIFRVDIIAPNGRGLSISAQLVSELSKAWRDPQKRRLCEELIVSLDCSREKGGRRIYLETKNGERITVKTERQWITRLELKKELRYPYLRVELTDGKGRHAWVNPMFPS